MIGRLAPPWDRLLLDARLATMRDDLGAYGVIDDGALAWKDGLIAWAGSRADLPGEPPALAARVESAEQRWITPGLVDCHTHLVFAGNRAPEAERRLQGATYADIAREGGGINATVRATRAATQSELVAQSRPRVAALLAEGVTTLEVKSGYGLDTASEMKLLRAARQIATELPLAVRTTLLAAHALPPEFSGRADDYIDYVCRDTIPAVAAAGLADAVDAFCETIGFSPTQVRRVFAAARAHGLPVKLHADQLSDLEGAALAAEAGALSADHLEYTNEAGIAAMARAGTVAVLLPGAYYALRETRLPPVSALRDAGVPIAIATDSNPGTSPVTSPLLMLNMACTLFRLTPEEALAGLTVHGARALGFADRGTLAPGQRADVVCWDIDEPAELAYRIGGMPAAGVVQAGHVAHWMR
jgi:imidazolonepropionase